MAMFRWILVAAMAIIFILLAASNWTPVDFILPDGTTTALPLPLLLGIAFLAGVIPTWIWHRWLRPLATGRRERTPYLEQPRVEHTQVASPTNGA